MDPSNGIRLVSASIHTEPKKSLVFVISLKLLSFALFLLLIKFDVMKKIKEKTTRKDIKTKGLNPFIRKTLVSKSDKKLIFFLIK